MGTVLLLKALQNLDKEEDVVKTTTDAHEEIMKTKKKKEKMKKPVRLQQRKQNKQKKLQMKNQTPLLLKKIKQLTKKIQFSTLWSFWKTTQNKKKQINPIFFSREFEYSVIKHTT